MCSFQFLGSVIFELFLWLRTAPLHESVTRKVIFKKNCVIFYVWQHWLYKFRKILVFLCWVAIFFQFFVSVSAINVLGLSAPLIIALHTFFKKNWIF